MVRPEPRNQTHTDLVFVTKRGLSFAAGQSHWRVAGEMTKLLRQAKVTRGGEERPVYRPGLSFYSLRHTLQTIGDGARDPLAVWAIMGHSPQASDMAAVYRQTVDDERLKAVTDYVRTWLFGEAVDHKESVE